MRRDSDTGRHGAGRHPTARAIVALVPALALALAACSDGAPDTATRSTSTSTSTSTSASSTTTTTTTPKPADVDVRGPVPGSPATSGAGGLDEVGYVEEEFFVAGRATAYTPEGELADDGEWAVASAGDAPYTTRILVKRPADPADASGVVLVEWNNVSTGVDVTPDWSFASAEILRAGHIHVAVSAQAAGVDTPRGGIGGGGGSPLTRSDPERYGELSHPGDDHSYDLFADIGRLLAGGPARGVDPLDGFPREHVIAVGESQSAFRLTTYVNAVHPVDPVFDGFLIHSRGGGAAPIVQDGDGLSSGVSGAVRIRTDRDEPVFVFSTETDLTLLGYARARQPDDESFHSWEVAGTAHADAFLVGGDPVAAGDVLGCGGPVNDGPQHFALDAALAALVTWVVDGRQPPAGDPIELDDTGDIARDADGNALGGVRLPSVVVPTGGLSGTPRDGSGLCRLFGSTTPFPPEELIARYGTPEEYVERYLAAFDDSVDAGFARAGDRQAAEAEAREVTFG